MVVYNSECKNGINWSNSVEAVWQKIGLSASKGHLARELAPKLPHLSLTDILFLGGVANMEERPHGIMTWVSEMFGLSRVSLYALTKRLNQKLSDAFSVPLTVAPPEKEGLEAYVKKSQRQIDRFILTGMFPGNVSTRPMQVLLEEAYGQSRSVGYISQLKNEAGRRAGELLDNIRYEAMGPVVALRDETFFNGQPILIVVDPISTVIVAIYVCLDRTADTWAPVLLDAVDKGLNLVGLVEDMAKMYPQSLKKAKLEDVSVQKDVWHFLRELDKVTRKLEKQAYTAIGKVYDLERALAKEWNEDQFEKEYIPAVAAETRRIDRYDLFAEWANHLADSLLLVDPTHGDIRDFDTNHWLMNECLTAFTQMDDPLINAFAKKLRKYQYQLLAFFDWTSHAITDYEHYLTQLIPDPNARQQFIRSTAKCWVLRQALINGHSFSRQTAQSEQECLASVAQTSTHLAQAAQKLRTILESAIRASSLVEMVNGLLKSFLKNRKSFAKDTHLQYYLNLFALWHNSRVYDKRNKRGSSSPFQMAGIELPSQDWLSLLGFAPAN